MKVIVLDSTPLAELCRKKPKQEVIDLLKFIDDSDFIIKIAEITEYEVRRELLRTKKDKACRRLGRYHLTERTIPINREALILASEIWAELRNSGKSTASNQRIDCDTIMIAQSLSLKKYFDEIIVLTSDPEDISRFCQYGIKVWRWQDALKIENQAINYYIQKFTI